MLDNINNEHIVILFILLTSLYIISIDCIPQYLKNIFSNTSFKIIFLSVIFIYSFYYSGVPHLALLIILIFIISLDNKIKAESFEDIDYLKHFQ